MRAPRIPAWAALVTAATALLPALAAAESGSLAVGPNQDSTVLTLELKAGEWVDYSWSANASLDFRIENAGGANTFVDRAGQVGSGAFQAPSDGSYRFEFRNRANDPVSGQWTVAKRADSTLLIVLLLVVVAGAFVALVLRAQKRKRGAQGEPPKAP